MATASSSSPTLPHPQRRQRPRPLRQRQHRLAAAVPRLQLAERREEAVAGVARQQHQVVVGRHHDADERGPRRRADGAGERLALAARRRQAVAGQRVGAPGRVEEDRGLVAAPARGVQEGVAGAVAAARAARARAPLPARTQPFSEIATVIGSEGTSCSSASARAASRRTIGERRGVAVLLGVGLELVAHLPRQPLLRLEDALELVALAHQLVLLAADLHLLEAGEVAQLELEDGLGLRFGEREARHQHRPGLLLAADDGDHLVDVEEGDEEAFEDVQARQHAVVAVLQPPAHRLGAERSHSTSMVRSV